MKSIIAQKTRLQPAPLTMTNGMLNTREMNKIIETRIKNPPITNFKKRILTSLLCLIRAESAPPFHMWARHIPIGFCQLQHFAFVTRATVTAWKQNRQWSMRHLVSQLLRKWTTIRESFSHCTWIIRCQGYLIKVSIPLLYREKYR